MATCPDDRMTPPFAFSSSSYVTLFAGQPSADISFTTAAVFEIPGAWGHGLMRADERVFLRLWPAPEQAGHVSSACLLGLATYLAGCSNKP